MIKEIQLYICVFIILFLSQRTVHLGTYTLDNVKCNFMI